MEHDPRLTLRRRDRALDRLNGLTTGAATLGLIATAGFGTVAAITTHVPGVSASDTTDQGAGPADAGPDDRGTDEATGSDGATDDAGRLSPQGGEAQPLRPSAGNGSSSGNVSPPKVTAVAPRARSTTRSHASTGGS
jgi:hypothetical protein